jgi:hypothetical protein
VCLVSAAGAALELPPFDEDGLLPPGDYEMSLEELKGSMLVEGSEEGYPNWDSGWRYPGLQSGIRDQFGNNLPFPSAFRLSRREYKPKGIVKIAEEGGGESA